MASPSIASYFNVRKRAATDDIINSRNKVIRLDDGDNTEHTESPVDRNIVAKNKLVDSDLKCINVTRGKIAEGNKTTERRTTRRTTKRNAVESKEQSTQPKIVKFTLAGTLSPNKQTTENTAFKPILKNSEEKFKSPQKAQTAAVASPSSSKTAAGNKTLADAKKDLSFDEIKSIVSRSSKLEKLKSILNRRKQLEEQHKACISERHAKQTAATVVNAATSDGKGLKQFETIELEVLSSPQKGLRTPTKTPVKEIQSGSPSQNDLMSPKRATTPRQLFSPSKKSPVPAYQRFKTLAESGTPSLQLPYKYRCLLEVFRCVDSICAMYYNRKETITFKKLKPAIQRMLRKNFSETHLAQIKYLYPDAYHFEQRKMLNPGSHTKYDYYQLVITPNIESMAGITEITPDSTSSNDDNIVKKANETTMNPHIITLRHKQFQNFLLDRVKTEHDAFLKSLNPPIIIPKEKLRRWHQDFDLESCPDILQAVIPQPPNIEKFSSAKDILSTARNLFNCSTPTERVMERYEAHVQKQTELSAKATNATSTSSADPSALSAQDHMAKMLKNVPKSLLEKIRAKQAAKELDKMTRRPSQDLEASKYARLPELAKYVRNIFVTENKGVLEFDKVMSKLENSVREKMTRECLRELLELMAREAPRNWLTFHFIRKTDFIKINRHENLNEVIKELERKAQEKAE